MRRAAWQQTDGRIADTRRLSTKEDLGDKGQDGRRWACATWVMLAGRSTRAPGGVRSGGDRKHSNNFLRWSLGPFW